MTNQKRLLLPISVVMGVALFTSACAGTAGDEPVALPGEPVVLGDDAANGDGSEGAGQRGGNGLFQNGVDDAASADDAASTGSTTSTSTADGDAGPDDSTGNTSGAGTSESGDPSGSDSDPGTSGTSSTTTPGSTDTESTGGSSGGSTDTTEGSSGGGKTPHTAAPVIDYFDVSKVQLCKTTGDVNNQVVTASWKTSHADTLYIAIDHESGPYESGLPKSGSLDVPGPGCSEPNIYYLVAENKYGRTSKQITRTGVPTETEKPDPPKEETVVAPKVSSFSVSEVKPCATPTGPPPDQVTVQWNIVGADEISVAIDNEYGAYAEGLPASGSIKLPAPNCQESSTYYVVATNKAGRTVKQQTRTATVAGS